MIGKGNHHRHGVKLAAYLMTGHPGERAELIEMRDFGPVSDLRDGFRAEHIRARDGTRADAPFFHVQLRGAHGEGLKLTDAQMLEIADRCDTALGLAGQPRAASLHINRQTGDRHLHLGYSLVAESEDGRLYVRKLGLYKNKLKALSRELEKDYGLQIVSNERQPHDRAPIADRGEIEESRRIGTDVRAIRTAILDCLEQSDGGKSFKAALEARGFMLATGDRRDCFVVVDAAGGQHALNKKLTGQTLAQMRDRLADLDRSRLPGVEQAQVMQQAKEPRQQREPAADRETRGAQEQAASSPQIRPLGRTAGDIRTAWRITQTTAQFVERIKNSGLILVYVSADEAKTSARAQTFAKATGRQNRALREGFAVVDSRGTVTRIDQRTTGDQREEIDKRLAGIDRAALVTVAEARAAMKEASRAAWIEQRRPPGWIERRLADCADKARIAGATVQQDAHGRTVTGAEALADRMRPDGERQTQSKTVQGREAFAARLDEAGIVLARVTEADVTALAALRQDEDRARLAAETNNEARRPQHFAKLEIGELAAVTRRGEVYRINPAKTGDAARHIGGELRSVVEARAAGEIERAQKAALWQQRQADHAARRVLRAEAVATKQQADRVIARTESAARGILATSERWLFKSAKAGVKTLSKTLDGIGSAALGILDFFAGPAKPPTLEEAQGMQRSAEERAQELADSAAQHTEDQAARWRQFEQDRTAQQSDLSFAQRYGRPPTREANLGRGDRDEGYERERERDR
jgi:Relaxase/Mobilisation nuclease domain